MNKRAIKKLCEPRGKKMAKALGLDDQIITISLDELPGQVTAKIQTLNQYSSAHVTIDPDAVDCVKDIDFLLLHEYIHILMGSMDLFQRNLMSYLADKQEDEHVINMIDRDMSDALERANISITKAILTAAGVDDATQLLEKH